MGGSKLKKKRLRSKRGEGGRRDRPGLHPTARRYGVTARTHGSGGTQGSAKKGLGQEVCPAEAWFRDGAKGPISNIMVPRRHPHSPAGSGTALLPLPPLPPPWLTTDSAQLPCASAASASPEATPLSHAQNTTEPLHWREGPLPITNHLSELLTPPITPSPGNR